MKKKLLLCFMIALGLSVQGQNLHTQANAASILNEANATTGWTGNAAITSSNVNPFQGNFSLSATSTGSTGNTRDMNYTFTAVVGQVYTISIWAREGNLSAQPAFANWAGFTGFSTTPIVGNNWSQYTWNLTATSTSPLIRVYTAPYNGGQVGSQVLIDNVSITVQDNTPPTAPSNLTASGTTTTTTNLSWTASTDNIGVTSYNVFQNGGIIGTTPGVTNFNVTGLTENTSYNFTVSANDAAGNTSGLSNTANVTTLTADTDSPTVLIQGAPDIVNTTTAYNVTLEFSEDVIGFDQGDLVLVNATASNFISVDGNTYTVDITPTGAGDITIDVPADVAQDAAGNNNTAAAQVTTTFDAGAPTVLIQNAPASVNTTAAYNVTLEFSEDVVGFDQGDLVLGNATASNFISVDGNTYTVDITPSGAGDITIDVPADVAQDTAGNNNIAAAQVITIFDAGAPTVLIQNAPASVNTTAAYNVTLEFSEDVVGFDQGDLVLVNATASNFISVDGNTYTVDITPSGAGNITIDVPADVAQDTAGNNNTAAVQVTTIFDAGAPSVVIQGAPASVNTTAAYNVTLEFSEDVVGFDQGDLVLGNATASNFISVDDNTYTVDITPTGAGDITIDVPANVAQDLAGNNNTAAAQVITIFDAGAPTVLIQNAPASVNTTAAYNVTLEFSEDVVGFDQGDLVLVNATASNFISVDGNTYTVDITPSGAGDITIDVPANVAQDAAGNNNTAAAQVTTIFDAGAPTVLIQNAPASVNTTDVFNVALEFSEDVVGFDQGDLVLGNATASNFISVDGNTYTVDITPTGAGDITIDVPANVAQDTAGNNNTAAAQVTTTFDAGAPTVLIQNAPASVNTTDVFNVTLEFNEDVVGFDQGDLVLVNATASNFISVDGNTYTVDISPTGAGDITIDVPADVAQDISGNNNTAAIQVITIFDAGAPSVVIQGAPGSVNTTAAYNVTLEFSEDVVGFDQGDLVLVNATASNFIAVDGNTYTVNITPSGTGDITIDVPANVAQDAAGNNNTAAAQVSTIFDAGAPSVVIQGAPASVNTTDVFNVTLEFNEDVIGFDQGDLVLVNATASNFISVDGNTYTVDITPSGAGDITIDVPADVAQDAAGNNNTAAAQVTTTFDAGAPTVLIQNAPASVNTTAAYNVTLEFSEDVVGFDQGDLVLVNATASNFIAVDGNTYTVDITPSGAGDITIDVPADVAQDTAGNNNIAAAQVITIFDSGVPFVVIQGAPGSVNTTTAYNVTLEFSEDVVGFDQGDLVLVNATASSFIAVDGNTYTVDISPTGAGDITIDVPADVAQDISGNNNTAAVQVTTIFDVEAPSVVIQGAPASVNTTAVFNVTLEFSEDVIGFEEGDLVLVNATSSNFVVVDGNTYTVDITPTGAGDITIDVPAEVAQDTAGNSNTAAAQVTTTFDDTQPSVVIQGAPESVNTTAAFNVTLDFSEDVVGFDQGDLVLVNATVSNFIAVDGNTYTVDITPTGAGNITIDVPADVAQDTAGNNNTAAAQVTTIFDAGAPNVVIQGAPASVNTTAAYNVTAEFSEDVVGFEIADLVLGNATSSNFVAVDGNTYTVDITPSGAGDITIDIAANVAQDNAGNENTAAAQVTTLFDTSPPTVLIQNAPASVNTTTAYNVTLEYSEDVVGFDQGDLVLGNATASNFISVDGNTYTVDITPSGAGDITIDVPADVAQDAAGNNNTAAAQVITIFDAGAPTVLIQNAPASVNTTAAYNVTVEFSEDVVGFDQGDLVLGNATASNFISVDGNTYTVDITPSGAGDITIDVPADVAQDTAGNNNTAAAQVTTTFDATQPSVVIQGAPESVNTTDVFNVTFDFSEDVVGFDQGDLVLVNATVSNFIAVDGNTYTVDITPTGAGNITIDVPADVAQDTAGNNNTAAAQVTTIFDAGAPSVVIQGAPASVNTTDVFNVTLEFSEDVVGFDQGDLVLVNATASNFIAVDGNTYTVDITPTGAGNITIDVPADVAQDTAGNNNTAAVQVTTIFDAGAPSVVIQGAPASVNTTAAYNVTLEFSEDVVGFDQGDLVLVNATASNFIAVDGNSYMVDITPTGAGDITIDVPADVAQDTAGNNNTAAVQVTTIFDAGAPSVVIQGAPASVNTTAAYNVTLEFSEDVVGFDQGDLVLVNATASNFISVDGNTYTVDITPSGAGDITIDIAANVAQDNAGNENTAAAQVTTLFDTSPPTVLIQNAPASVNTTTAYNVTLEYSEDVVGFDQGDLVLGNATASNFISVDGNTYTVDITPSGAGDITIDVPADVAQDAAGNNNTAAAQVITIFDAGAPSVLIQNAPASVNTTAAYNVTLEFSEDVVGFDQGDLVLVNATASNFIAVDGNTYTVDITPTGAGDITIDVPANVAQDTAGNNSTAAAQVITIFDAGAPSVVIQGAPASVNTTAAYNVTLEFSEDVVGFDQGDLVLVNATASNFISVDGNTYTVDITPSGAGDITIDVPANVAQDLAGNNNTAAAQVITIFDAGAPSVLIQNAPASVNTTTAYNVTLEFSEDVVGFDQGDLVLVNATASNFIAVDGNTYTVDITPTGAGDITIDVPANVAQDTAGNNSTAAAQVITIFDAGAPSVVIQGAPASVNTTAAYNVTLEFSEDVVGFDQGDLVLVNATASNFISVDGNTYTVDITPSGAGDITIDVPANVAQDAAGNNNTAAAQVTTIFDAGAPSVVIQGAPASVNTTAAYNVTLEFSEDVVGFDQGDLVLVNATASNFIAVDGNSYMVDITPTGAGDITIDVPADVAQDTAGNNNTAAVQVTTIFDAGAPSVVIQGAPASVNTTTAYNVTLEFSEDVVGFDQGDLVLVNATASNFISVDGNTYTVDITPSGAGDITIDVPAAVAQDPAGNNNTAAAQVVTTFNLDDTPPNVVISGAPEIVNNTNPYNLSIDFSEDVTGFEQGDIVIGNGTATNFITVGPSNYTVEITPNGTGNITIDIPANVAQDLAGNNSTAALTVITTYDAIAPSTNIIGEPLVVNTTNPYSITIEFSEGVLGFELGDVIIGNGTSSNFMVVDGNTYTLDISPTGAGDITVDVPANVAQDVAGNNNTAASQAITSFDDALHYTSENANLITIDWQARDLNAAQDIFATRNVGIGTLNTQGYRLAVDGNVIAEEIKVELSQNWPDFVFEKKYVLPSLEEVEKHILENGHLENIPSAKEVAESGGILLGEMNAKLLQKIEELTLYSIQQEKKIKKLQEENIQFQQLAQKLLELEKQIMQMKN
ncbi:hypothetical protein HCG49_11015 [Arenibacter sp. 6A1]|uniref:Ig-like domain-containing protein n=1 Tax=Arenibacter sp. 6A1 TaxID=2720391 RepID=UPI0014477217|nr:Ig-like domain-containing protein [Arenibacter sp. 6A1]NKI27094.1 hypothetical protein [Arenibacter sp. 6A1]